MRKRRSRVITLIDARKPLSHSDQLLCSPAAIKRAGRTLGRAGQGAHWRWFTLQWLVGLEGSFAGFRVLEKGRKRALARLKPHPPRCPTALRTRCPDLEGAWTGLTGAHQMPGHDCHSVMQHDVFMRPSYGAAWLAHIATHLALLQGKVYHLICHRQSSSRRKAGMGENAV